MTSDKKNPLCSDSDLFVIADEFHSLYLAHEERFIQLFAQWREKRIQEERTLPKSMHCRLLPLPQRELSLPEKAVCLAAIHDKVWKGDLITPFPHDQNVGDKDYFKKKEAKRDFKQLTERVPAIPASDLSFLNRHLNSIKDWLEHLERDNEASHHKTASPIDPSIELKRGNTKEIQNGEGSEPSLEFWSDSRPQQRRIVRFVLDNGGRTKRQKLEECEGIFTDPPPSNRTLRRALGRVNDALSMYALGWELKWSPELTDIDAEVWLKSPDKPKTEAGPA